MKFIKRFFKHTVRNFRRYLAAGVLCTVVLGGVVVYYGKKGAECLECNYLQLPEEALPGAGPMRIAFVSDIHNNPALFQKAIEQIKNAKPDLILLGGDYIMVNQRFMRTRWIINGLREMAEIAPVYAILGNQDYEKLGQLERVLQTAEIPLLRNEARNWETPAGGTVCIVGLGDWNEGDEDPHTCMLPTGEEESAVLLLSHDPESRWLLRQYDWDLMLSGHTHGGQIGNPFKNPVEYLSFRSSMPAGLFDFEGGRRVFVSRGVGSICGMRFFCPPEINIIDIGDRSSLPAPENEESTVEETSSESQAPAETDTPQPSETQSEPAAPLPPEQPNEQPAPATDGELPPPPPAPAEDSTLDTPPPAPADDSIIPELPMPE